MTIFRFSLIAVGLSCGAGLAQDAAIALPQDAAIALPSGQFATLIETIWEPQTAPVELWVRFRFLVPGISGADLDFAVVGDDLLALCQTVALPAIAKAGKVADQAVISLASEAIPFGEVNPDVTQYFEADRLTGGDCILEGF